MHTYGKQRPSPNKQRSVREREASAETEALKRRNRSQWAGAPYSSNVQASMYRKGAMPAEDASRDTIVAAPRGVCHRWRKDWCSGSSWNRITNAWKPSTLRARPQWFGGGGGVRRSAAGRGPEAEHSGFRGIVCRSRSRLRLPRRNWQEQAYRSGFTLTLALYERAQAYESGVQARYSSEQDMIHISMVKTSMACMHACMV